MNFEETWSVNYSSLRNFVALKVPAQEVSDILQTVSLEFYKSIESGKEIRKPKSWLFQVTRNTIADFFKSKSKSTSSELNFAHTSSDDFEPCACDIVEQTIDALLPTKYSVPLILSDLYKIPQKEIANQLGIGYESVKSRIIRARKKIKDKVLESTDRVYNKKGEIVSAKLKENNDFPIEIVEMIRQLQLEK